MVFGQDVLGEEGFEIIEKNWEKFVKVGEFLRKVGGFLAKTAYYLRKNWTIWRVFLFFGEKIVKIWSWNVVNIAGINCQ